MLDPPTNRPGELQGAVIGTGVVLHQHPADLDDALAVATNTEVHGIGCSILRQVRASARISEIAALTKFLVRRNDALMTGRGAVSGKTIAQRKATTMRPQLCIVPNGRKEVGTGQGTLARLWVVRSL